MTTTDTRQITDATIQTVSKPDWKYCGWPTLIRRRDGELMAAYCGGRDHHICPFGQIHVIRSADEGRSWSEPMVVADGPLDDRGAGLVQTADGDLLVVFCTSLQWENTFAEIQAGAPSFLTDREVVHWHAVQHQLDDDTRRRRLGCFVVRSEDGGETWSAPTRTPVFNTHGPRQLDDGRLLYAGKTALDTQEIGFERTSFPPTLQHGVAESADGGRTWRYLCDVNPPAGKKFNEPDLIETADGRLVMLIRYGPAPDPSLTLEQRILGRAEQRLYRTQSFDGGRTWETPTPTEIFGYPPHLIRLDDGRLLLTYGQRLAPASIQVRTSSDYGQTWSDAAMLHHDPQSTTDLGYPCSVQLDGQKMFTMWYERSKGETQARLKTAAWHFDQLEC